MFTPRVQGLHLVYKVYTSCRPFAPRLEMYMDKMFPNGTTHRRTSSGEERRDILHQHNIINGYAHFAEPNS